MRGFSMVWRLAAAGWVMVGLLGGCGPSGGDIHYQGSGVLDQRGGRLEAEGLSITALPNGLYDAVQFQVSTVEVPEGLPDKLVPVGDAADIRVDDGLRLNIPVLIDMQYQDAGIPNEDEMLVLHYDTHRAKYEAVTILVHDTDANVFTFESRRFSPFVIVWMATPPADSHHVGFDPTVHGWQIPNFGDHFSPGGNCLGMSAYTCYYFEAGTDDLYGKYTDDISKLVISRAHLAQSQYWAIKQFNDQQKLGDPKLGLQMKAFLESTDEPFIFLMIRPGAGHATVLYAYDKKYFYFYDVNYVGTEQDVSFTGGKFGNYSSYTSFGYVANASLGRTEDFGDLTAEAEGGFKTSSEITLESPADDEKIRTASTTVKGRLSGLNRAVELLSVIGGAMNQVRTGLGSFQFNWSLNMGPNSLLLLAGVNISRQSNWYKNAATRIIDVERVPETESVCDDSVDNDADGATDCNDEDCDEDPHCEEPPEEVCDDGIDNDEDGMTDCADEEDCAEHENCQPVECSGAQEIHCGDTVSDNTSGGSSTIDQYPACAEEWDESGPEKMYLLRNVTGNVSAELTEIEEDQDLDIFVLENNCLAEACIESGNYEAYFAAQPDKLYYIVVDGYEGSAGSFTLEIECIQ